ncbi:MAG: aminotransferase class IV family protein [Opitutaceae bacterium]|nr:aminotransferase class IV family protein [Opitutaceae bacterium]
MSVDYIQANTNGRLHDAREASIAPLNRGFLYGDAIYEVWRTYEGVLFAWQEHWVRLEQSAAALAMRLPATPAAMLEEIKCTAAAFRDRTGHRGELYVRLQITRGGGPIGLDPGLADRPDFVLLVQANRGLTPEKLAAGFRLSLATGLHRNHPASLNPAWKTGNYLNNILCLHEARGRGADEVVITNLAGEVTEAAVANLGFVCDGEVLTPPLSAGMLAGITRGLVLEHVAPAAGIRVRETPLRPEDFPRMQECFMLSTTKDVAPVGWIDAQSFRVGPDTLTLRLKAAFADYVRAYIARHPGQRL